MKIAPLAIPDVKLICPAKFSDARGFFSETYSRRSFAAAGFDFDFVQDNHSSSAAAGTVRGLHFQLPPFAQDKLVRVAKGAIVDVAVDIRKGSPSYGRHVRTILSATEWNQVLVPIGFAHGFCTLEPDTEVVYKVTNFYSPGHERGLLWNDPDLGIEWPIEAEAALLSEKDRRHPRLAQLTETF